MEIPWFMINGYMYWLDDINPYKAVDAMGRWRKTFNNDNTRVTAKMQLQKYYRKHWFKKFISLMEQNENKEKRVKVTKETV